MEWVEGSAAGDVPPDREAEVRVALQDFLETRIRFPAMLLSHWEKCHGGVPLTDTFDTPSGATRRIGRFLNLLTEDEATSGRDTWRDWRSGDIRLDYSLAVILDEESWEPAFGRVLVPFACLDTGGQNPRLCERFDLLCLDFEVPDKPPSVVTLDIAKSDYDDPVGEPVAGSYGEFASKLRKSDAGDWDTGGKF